MPRDVGFACKKRHHPDGFHLSSSSPKRLLSSSEAELDSSIDSATESTIRPECTMDSAHGSMWNSASADITSDCNVSMCVGRSRMSSSVVSSKPSLSVFKHSPARSDAASYNSEALKSARGSPFEARHKDIWMYRSADSACEGTASGSECSEVTYPGTRISMHQFEGVSFSGKPTHIISRREKSSLNPKWGMDEAWVKDAFGSDTMLRGKRLGSNSSSHSTSQRGELGFSSMVCESGSSCATGNPSMEGIRLQQGLPRVYGSVYTESLSESPNVHSRAEGLVGPQAQERSGGLEYFDTQRIFNTEVDLHSSFIHKGKTEEVGPSYVLSSGRLSLEEEARLGRRAPTIDHDFEEYFSLLMLE